LATIGAATFREPSRGSNDENRRATFECAHLIAAHDSLIASSSASIVVARLQ
jgi:hypothetical protein